MRDFSEEYLQGPTVCVAHPKVSKSIRNTIRKSGSRSVADIRLAGAMGLLGSNPIIRALGYGDGVFYPPGEAVPNGGPGLAPVKSSLRSGPMGLVKRKSTTGVLKALVLMVDFSDNEGSTPASHFENLLFNRNNPDSMASFYHDISYGKLQLEGEVVGWLRAPNPYSYYTAGASGTGDDYPHNTPGLLEDILRVYTGQHSFAGFDQDGDGYLDGLFLIHAGSGAEAQANTEKRKHMIWSHKWTLPRPFSHQGINAFAYFTAPEDGKLGVFSHEFGHFLGLPDLYDTSYRSEGAGQWCLMAAGSWGGGGAKPTRLSCWCLQQLGWITPQPVPAAGAAQKLSLPPIATDASASLRLDPAGEKTSEYYLLENRQQIGRDAALPGHGLAIWHINEARSGNDSPPYYRVGLVQADGRMDLEFAVNNGDDSDLFPGTAGVTAVSDKTTPTLRLHTGASSARAVSAIAEQPDGSVTFRVK